MLSTVSGIGQSHVDGEKQRAFKLLIVGLSLKYVAFAKSFQISEYFLSMVTTKQLRVTPPLEQPIL